MTTNEDLAAVHAAALTRRLNRKPGRVSPPRSGLGEYGAERETFPYWKVQFFLPRACAWQDIQVKHVDRALAQQEGLRVKAQKGRARLMEVQRGGRHPLPEL